jgi:hypothetical protein
MLKKLFFIYIVKMKTKQLAVSKKTVLAFKIIFNFYCVSFKQPNRLVNAKVILTR